MIFLFQDYFYMILSLIGLITMGLLSRISNFFLKTPDLPVSRHNQNESRTQNGTPIHEEGNILEEKPPERERELPDVYICRTCGKTFGTEAELLIHKSQKISEDRYPQIKSESTVSRKYIDPSQTNITNPQIPSYNQILASETMTKFLCKSCGRTFQTDEELQTHIHTPDEILAVPDISPESTVPRADNSIDTRFVNKNEVGVTNMGSERLRYHKFPGKIGYIRRK